jgi:hypothetical protein
MTTENKQAWLRVYLDSADNSGNVPYVLDQGHMQIEGHVYSIRDVSNIAHLWEASIHFIH